MGLSPGLFDQLDAIGDRGLLTTDGDLIVTGWNRWLERHSGIAAPAAVGRRLFDLFPDLPSRGVDRYFRQALTGQTVILSQRLHKYVLPLPAAVGEGAPMQQTGRIVPFLDGAAVCGTLAVIEDVTERVVREAELQTRGRQQAALASSARSALAGHEIIDLCSEAVRQLAATVGADVAEALELQPDGSTWARLAGIGCESSPAVFEAADATRALVARSEDQVVLGEPGGVAPDARLAAHGVLGGLMVRIPGRGSRPFGLLGAYTRSPRRFVADEVQFVQALADIVGTAVERKRLEAELRLRAAELAETDRRKDEFLAMLAHELRNPLAPVQNAVQILQTTHAADPLVTRMTGLMGRQVAHMAHMVDDLLDVSRVTRGRVTLRPERVALADLVARAVETARPLIDARHHELTVSVQPEPIVLDADPTRLVQVLGNLLNNAAKYTEEGGRIWLTASRDGDGDEAVVGVRDTGVGLTPEMRARAFDLFVQEQHTLDRSQGGLGIGLTLVRSLVELHGGTVGVTSEGRGRGSEFVVRLPALPVGVVRGEGAEAPTSTAALPRRFMIVDDNVDSAESLAELLVLTGHEVRTAHDGAAALQEVQAWRPGVVLLDIGLPRVDGYEVARRMRRLPGFGAVTLIAMTGYGQDEDRRRSREAGFDHHLVKPVGLDDIRQLLGTTPGAAPS